jgi:hypothetical protein
MEILQNIGSWILYVVCGAILLVLSAKIPAFKSFAITLLTSGVKKAVEEMKAKKNTPESKKDV